jgi:hypothetical protein
MTAVAKPIQMPVRVEPALPREMNDNRPTEMRYAWCPFKEINLVGPDGTISLYVQPHQIASGRYDDQDPVVIPNPYARVLPKMQLIPFPTFPQITYVLSEEQRDAKGSPVPVQSTRTATALENVASVARVYAGHGFTVLSALQGLDEETAGRIFQVVQPLEYPLHALEGELEFGALERIESHDAILFELGDGEVYHVDPLRTDDERAKARALASEMLSGASVAVRHATEILDDTIVSIRTRLAGGQGKTGPDPLDIYVAEQLGREKDIPSAGGTTTADSGLGEKIDFLVDREVQRSDKERIADLERQLEEMKAGRIDMDLSKGNEFAATLTEDAVIVEYGVCGHIKTNGQPCQRKTPKGEKCGEHAGNEE